MKQTLQANPLSHPSLNLGSERIVKEKERQFITSISRSQAFQLERHGRFPQRIQLSGGSIGWKLSELLNWVAALPYVDLSDSQASEEI